MVGIAGKSKACLDCKRRRVKCDLTAPACLRCAKAGIACRGYNTRTLWVNRTPAQPGTTALSVIAEAREQQLQQRQASRWLHLLRQLRSQLTPPSSSSSPSSSLPSSPGSSSAQHDTARFRAQALLLLQGIYLPQPHITEGGGNSGSDPTPFSWPVAVCGMPGASEALDHALLAFCAIQVRVSGEARVSYDDAVRLYNDALGKVIRALGRDESDDETLAAIVVLSTCELFVFSTDQSWSAHAQGISELLRHRGVPAVPTPSWRSLCLRLCVICVIQSLAQRHSLSLAPDRWRELVGPAQSPAGFPRLLEIAAEVPAIMEDVHALLSRGAASHDGRSHHYKRILVQKYHQLDAWRQRYQQMASPGQFYWPVLSRLESPADEAYPDKLFPFALKFHSIEDAITWIFCCTITLQVLEGFLRLDALPNTTTMPSPLSHGSTSGSDPVPTQADADALARRLCQSVEFCYGIENGTFGPQGTCSTQWALLNYFRRRGLRRELEWCENIKNMRGPASSCGIDLMRFGPG
ncbi:ebs-bah-phd domain-containing protein [Purpureocillium lavendulum]|uniref:Ebs-bah-phd domain-containing protein n=1 Tax=Purpureocillium lavendulum TaxID=1247861 RepID=A0AB34FED2_9HYPO|nr:ebs-bah-phd domain-containing protein [Purpureocillium lavendulum]